MVGCRARGRTRRCPSRRGVFFGPRQPRVADDAELGNKAALSSAPKPLIDSDDLVSGGPPPDGIPPIDNPRFASAWEIDWVAPKEPMIVVDLKGETHIYPVQIMTWHEIVNDDVGEVPVTVTFCPLCNTAYAYKRPVIDGKLTTFGTSGKFYNSNLVMYDRATESYWPQALGRR